MENPHTLPRLEDIKSISDRLGIGRSTIYAWVKEGQFPPPTKLGKSARWVTSEVNTWISERAIERERVSGTVRMTSVKP